jgi:hypothetical protein
VAARGELGADPAPPLALDGLDGREQEPHWAGTVGAPPAAPPGAPWPGGTLAR